MKGVVTSHVSSNITSQDREREECGIFCLRGEKIKSLRRPVAFLVFLCLASFAQSMCVNGFIGVTMSTVEKRYGLKSARSGWIPASYEFAGIPVLIILGVIGNRIHRPRWISLGMILFAIGSLLYSLPHFLISGNESPVTENYCSLNDVNATMTSLCASENGSESSQLHSLIIFIIATILMALGSNPLFLLGTAYMDDCVTHAQSALYLSIFLSFSGFGPAVGYVLASIILNHLYVDMTFNDKNPTSASDPRWVGAWWVGFLLCSVLGALIAIPLYAYPKHLKDENINKNVASNEELQLVDIDDTGDQAEEFFPSSGQKLMNGVPAQVKATTNAVADNAWTQMKALLSNGTFIFIVLSGVGDAFLIGGFTTFGPKYLETEFKLTAGGAGILFGLATVPGAVGGTIFGGWLIKRLRLSLRGLLYFHVIGHVICLLVGGSSFLIQCDNVPFAGITINSRGEREANFSDWQCNVGCSCDRDSFDPLCGDDGITYFSPCYAACSTACVNDQCAKCSCIGHYANGTGVKGVCQSSDCHGLFVFMALFFTAMFAFLATGMFNLQIVLRCIAIQHKTMSLSISWVIGRIFGTVPGPLIFGAAIDLSCLLWATRCEDSSSCLLYDSRQMAWLILILYVSCKASSVLFALAGLIYFKKKGKYRRKDISVSEVTETLLLSTDQLAGDLDKVTDTLLLSTDQLTSNPDVFVAPSSELININDGNLFQNHILT